MSDCHYCTQLYRADADYPLLPAEFELDDACPRCARRWRYLYQSCGRASYFSHPCFHTPGSGWLVEPPDSPRREDWGLVDTALNSLYGALSDDQRSFQSVGLRVTELEKPAVMAWGEDESPSHLVRHLKRSSHSLAFRLEWV